MCIPVAALSLVAGIAQGVVGYMGQMSQYEHQQAQFEANREASQRAAVNQYASQQLRIQQEGEAAAQTTQDVALEGQAARSTARTAAGEAGVSGLSVNALLQDLSAQEGPLRRFGRQEPGDFTGLHEGRDGRHAGSGNRPDQLCAPAE